MRLRKFILLIGLIVVTASGRAADFEYDNMWYNITSVGGPRTCALTQPPCKISFPKRVVIPSVVAYKGFMFNVTSIDERAFLGANKFKSLTIPATINYISKKSFVNVDFSNEITFNCDSLIFENGDYPIYVKEFEGYNSANHFPLAKYLFIGRDFCSTRFSDDKKECSARYDFDYTVRLAENSVETLRFSPTAILKKLEFGDKVSYIPAKFFYFCQKLEEIKFGENIVYIGSFSFKDCQKLTALHFPPKLRKIGLSAFWGCTDLKFISFGPNIECIDTDFSYCEKIETIVCQAINPPVWKELRPSIYYNAVVYVPKGSAELYRQAEYWKNFIEIREVENNYFY